MWQFNAIRDRLMSQRKTGTLIGGVKEVVGHTMFWVSMINFTLIAATAYNTTLFPYLSEKAPWFSFWLFLVVLAVLVGLAMLVEYKLIIPSVMAFRNKQEYEHQNLLRKDLDEIKSKLDELVKYKGGA